MIREKRGLRDIPIIFITSNDEKDDVIKATAYEVDAYEVNSIDKEILD